LISISYCSVSSFPFIDINENFKTALIDGFLGKLRLPVGIFDV